MWWPCTQKPHSLDATSPELVLYLIHNLLHAAEMVLPDPRPTKRCKMLACAHVSASCEAPRVVQTRQGQRRGRGSGLRQRQRAGEAWCKVGRGRGSMVQTREGQGQRAAAAGSGSGQRQQQGQGQRGAN